jgi:hypothetical protein
VLASRAAAVAFSIMSFYTACFLSLLLLADADVPRINGLRPAATPAPTFAPGDEIELFPPSSVPAPSDQQPPSAAQPASLNLSGTLQDNSKLLLIRYVSGELAKAVKPLPAGKEGFIVTVGAPTNTEQLDRAVATHGAAIHAGDNVVISKLEFQNHQIVVDLNGGGRGKKRLRDRIHIEMSGMPTEQVSSTNPNPDAGPAGLQPGLGSTIFLEFNKAVPDLTPDNLKTLLSPFLNFNNQRSASVQWIDTLPPDIKKAIQEREAVVGMDREMVVAAVGKPDHKVRERDADGNDIEDWIYGQPPSKTVFVRFTGERVTSVKQFPK